VGDEVDPVAPGQRRGEVARRRAETVADERLDERGREQRPEFAAQRARSW
jgi:hypothetical protein